MWRSWRSDHWNHRPTTYEVDPPYVLICRLFQYRMESWQEWQILLHLGWQGFDSSLSYWYLTKYVVRLKTCLHVIAWFTCFLDQELMSWRGGWLIHCWYVVYLPVHCASEKLCISSCFFVASFCDAAFEEIRSTRRRFAMGIMFFRVFMDRDPSGQMS